MKKPMLYHLDTTGGGLIGGEEGEFVLFSDWEALKTERDSLKKDVQDLKNRDEYRENHIADIKSERDELRKEVKQLQDILIKRMP